MSDAVAHTVNHYAYNLKFIPRPDAARKTKKAKKMRGKYLGEELRK